MLRRRITEASDLTSRGIWVRFGCMTETINIAYRSGAVRLASLSCCSACFLISLSFYSTELRIVAI